MDTRALCDTLRRMNWVHGRGDVTDIDTNAQEVKVQKQYGTESVRYHLGVSKAGAKTVTFRGRTRVIRGAGK